MSERGVFAVDRGIWTDPEFPAQPFTDREAFLWLVGEAAWRPTKVRVGSVAVEIRRGECAFSLRFMAAKWQWSEPKVRRFLARMKKFGNIDARADAGVTHLTICNYDRFQRVSLPSDAPCDADPTQKRRKEEDRENTRDNTLAEAGTAKAQPQLLFGPPAPEVPDAHNDAAAAPKARKANEYPPEFEALWVAYRYDKKGPKQDAYAQWRKLSAADQLAVIASIPAFEADRKKTRPWYTPPYLAKYLAKIFREFVPQVGAGSSVGQSAEERAHLHRLAVKRWRQTFLWPPNYGPEPGEPGCLVAPEILAEFGIKTRLAKVKGEAA